MSQGFRNDSFFVPQNVSGGILHANGAAIDSDDGNNILVSGITFDGTNILNIYSGEQVFNPELKFDGSSGFDNGPGIGQVVLIGQVYFWSFSIVLGVNTGAVGGNAQIVSLPPGFSTASVMLTSTGCNLSAGYNMVMDASGFLYQQTTSTGTPPANLVQANFGEGALIQGQGFFFA